MLKARGEKWKNWEEQDRIARWRLNVLLGWAGMLGKAAPCRLSCRFL
jgi:hypothetical protein